MTGRLKLLQPGTRYSLSVTRKKEELSRVQVILEVCRVEWCSVTTIEALTCKWIESRRLERVLPNYVIARLGRLIALALVGAEGAFKDTIRTLETRFWNEITD